MQLEKTIKRIDGTTIVIVGVVFTDVFSSKTTIDYFIKVKDPSAKDWRYVYPNNSPDKSLGGMSVEEYKKRGRKGLLSVVSAGELIKARQDFEEMLAGRGR